MYRFEMKVRGRNHGGASALQHVSYLLRDTEGPAAGHVAYMLRQSAKTHQREDLVASGHGNLPAWAHDSPQAFWQAAEQYERVNGRTATTWIVSLPRELTREEQLGVVRDMMQTQFGTRHPYVWAIHAAVALDGKPNPHVHVAFASEVMDGLPRDTPEQFFTRWNSKDPARGGARKETRIHARGALLRQRQAWADLCNMYLERGGHAERVDHRSLAAQGIERDPVEYLSARELTQAKYTKRIGPGLQERFDGAPVRERQAAQEQARAMAAWQQRKEALGWYPTMPHATWVRQVEEHSRLPQQQAREGRPRIAVPERVSGEVLVRALREHDRQLTARIEDAVHRAERGHRATPTARLAEHQLLHMDDRQMVAAAEGGRDRPARQRDHVRIRGHREERGRGSAVRSRIFDDDHEHRERER